MSGPTSAFWQERFDKQETRWDRGAPSPQLLAWQPDAPLDAIYEQTCLCAIHPDHWTAYAAQLQRWLKPGGTLFALFMQMVRPGATQEGLIEGPPYHCDINAMRALFPATQWDWPKPPYAQVQHPSLSHELAVPLRRR